MLYNVLVMNKNTYLIEVYRLRITEIDFVEGDTDNVSEGKVINSDFVVDDISKIICAHILRCS